MAVLPVGIGSEVGAGGYQIERSLRFNSADSAYLNRTFGTPTNNKKWSISMWVKRSKLGTNQHLFNGGYDGSDYLDFRFNTSDQLYIQNRVGASNILLANTTAVFRDVSAWYHLVFVFDSDNATAAYRNRLWMNNVEYTWSANSGLSDASSFNVASVVHALGISQTTGSPGYWAGLDGYLTEINFIDGQALDPTSFGEFNEDTGVWQPKAYTGSYGTNGFYLDFADNTSTTTLGYDAAGSNDWTLNNFSVTAGAGNDSLVDSPTRYGTDTGAGGDVRGNFCTLNALRNGGFTLSNGNLDFGGTTSDRQVAGTIAFPTSGKWYFEAVPTAIGANSYWGVGIMNTTVTVTSGGLATEGFEGYAATGLKFSGAGYVSYGNSFTTNDVIGVAVDMDNGAIYFAKNNTWQNSGDPTSGSSKTGAAFTDLISSGYTWTPAIFSFNTGQSGITNFGQRPFAYTAPSGFLSICTTNLPEPTIADGGEYFNVIEYEGNGSTNARTGVGFQPDFVWIKETNAAADHALYDAVRGVQQQLESNTITDETTEANGLTAFGTDGFTVGSLAQVNTNLDTYVAWCWKANGAGVSNTAGTITSTVSVNTTSGFSIVSYTGTGANATVGHGLGVAPSMIIVKRRASGTTNWPVYHIGYGGNNYYQYLDTTQARTTDSVMWNNTAPTSSVFSVGTYNECNSSGNPMLAYCFAPVSGFSSMGSYVGNGSADGPFVYTGFRPAYVLWKRTDSVSDWNILDSTRDPYNFADKELFPNLSDAETVIGGGLSRLDLLSNGFKVRGADSYQNASGGTYIYMAFSEVAFNYSLGR